MRRVAALLLAMLPLAGSAATPQPEYALKAAFIYNFALFTTWPASIGDQLLFCTLRGDPFGGELDDAAGRMVGPRTVRVRRGLDPAKDFDAIAPCNVLYVPPAAVPGLAALRARLGARPMLVVTDADGALESGAALNMRLSQGRVAFEANRSAARAAGLDLDYQLLRLATRVIQ